MSRVPVELSPTEQRLAITCRRCPPFPRAPAVLVRLVKSIYTRIHDDANALLRPLGINHPEYNLLMMLYGSENFTLYASQLAEAAGEKSANITRLTNELCDKQWVERTADAADRRKVALTLTEAGVAMIESLLPDIGALLNRQAAGLQPREMVQLERLLKKLLNRPEQA
ncbi:MAG: MarR family winged helix-turn-helix transcriptional regulator [Rhodanobacter sp.]